MKSKLIFHGNGKVYVGITNEEESEVIDGSLDECKACMHDAPYKWCCKTVCGENELCKNCIAKSKMIVNECPYKVQR